MSCDVHEFFEGFKKDAAQMQKAMPDAIAGFGNMFAAIMKDGAVSLKVKELVAVGIALAVQCEPCIRLHVQKAYMAGATGAEITEAASVALMMGGGPAYTHMPIVIETLEALSSQK